MRSIRNALAVLACLTVLTLTDTAAQPGARAQACPPITLAYVLRDGQTMSVFYCETRWPGIGSDTVHAAGGGYVRDVNGKAPDKVIRPPAILISNIRFLCVSKCPADLPTAEVTEDTVLWKDGSRTTGRFEIRCADGWCRVHHDGKPHGSQFRGYSHLPRELVYIAFGRAK